LDFQALKSGVLITHYQNLFPLGEHKDSAPSDRKGLDVKVKHLYPYYKLHS